MSLHRSMALVLLTLTASSASPVLGQDVISGKFYRFQVVGRVGLADISAPRFTGPSINDNGQVAFSATATGGTTNAIYVGDLGAAAPRKTAVANTFSFTSGIEISNNQHTAALDLSQSIQSCGFRQGRFQNWNIAPGTPTGTIIAQACVPPPGFSDFRQIFFPASINNLGQVAFSAQKAVGAGFVNKLVTGTATPALNQIDMAFPDNSPPQPMITEDSRVVVRAGNLATDPIRLYDFDLLNWVDIATSAQFAALGQSPGVSANGEVVAFYGDLTEAGATSLGTTAGPGIFASVLVGPGSTRRIVR